MLDINRGKFFPFRSLDWKVYFQKDLNIIVNVSFLTSNLQIFVLTFNYPLIMSPVLEQEGLAV